MFITDQLNNVLDHSGLIQITIYGGAFKNFYSEKSRHNCEFLYNKRSGGKLLKLWIDFAISNFLM